jgi:hypothetical protein
MIIFGTTIIAAIDTVPITNAHNAGVILTAPHNVDSV